MGGVGGGAPSGSEALARGGAGSLTPGAARGCADPLPASPTPESPPAAPAAAGPEDAGGAPRARDGGSSGPRFPFKGSRNFPPWYQMRLVTSVGRGRPGALRGNAGLGEEARPRAREGVQGGRARPGAAGAPRSALGRGGGAGPCGAAVARQGGQRRATCSTWRRAPGRLRRLRPSPEPPAARRRPVRPQPGPAAPRRAAGRRRRRTGQHGAGRARAAGAAAGMGALARALLPPLLAQGLLCAAAALAAAPFTLPLRVAAATGRGAAPTPGPGPPAEPRADGLAFALEPAAGAANFLAMVDNLQGDSGRGYYLEVLIGTPPQKVGGWAPARPPSPAAAAGVGQRRRRLRTV